MLHTMTAEELASFPAYREAAPPHVPAPRPLPTVADVLAAFRAADAHGTWWFRVKGVASPDPLAALDERFLGEVSLQDRSGLLEEVDEATPVMVLSFRKGSGLAIREALHVLSRVAGEILVFIDTGPEVLVISPDSDGRALAAQWPFGA
jgi:hypothetical protein